MAPQSLTSERPWRLRDARRWFAQQQRGHCPDGSFRPEWCGLGGYGAPAHALGAAIDRAIAAEGPDALVLPPEPEPAAAQDPTGGGGEEEADADGGGEDGEAEGAGGDCQDGSEGSSGENDDSESGDGDGSGATPSGAPDGRMDTAPREGGETPQGRGADAGPAEPSPGSSEARASGGSTGDEVTDRGASPDRRARRASDDDSGGLPPAAAGSDGTDDAAGRHPWPAASRDGSPDEEAASLVGIADPPPRGRDESADQDDSGRGLPGGDSGSPVSPNEALVDDPRWGGACASLREAQVGAPARAREPEVRAAGRALARIFAAVEMGTTGEPTPRVSGRRLVRELVGRSYRPSRWRREEAEPKVRLVLVDCSGSCAGHADQTLAAAVALAHADPTLCAVAHSNGLVYEAWGQPGPAAEIGRLLLAGVHPERDAHGHDFWAPGPRGPALEGGEYLGDADALAMRLAGRIGGAVAFGDGDGWWLYAALIAAGVRLVWLTPYGCRSAEVRVGRWTRPEPGPWAWIHGVAGEPGDLRAVARLLHPGPSTP